MGRIPVAEPRVGAARAAVLILAAALTFAGCAASVPATPALTRATPTLTPATPTLTPATPPPMPTPALTPVAVTGSNGPAGFVPKAIAFADTERGWVAGTTGGDAAFVLETTDGGRTWSASEVGAWVATAIASAPDGAWVALPCPDDEPTCTPSLKHRTPSGTWEPASAVAPLAIDFAGTTGVIAVVLPGGPTQPNGMPVPVIRVTQDAGGTWTNATNPCGLLDLEAVSLPSAGELLALCGGEGAGGGQAKRLFVSGGLGTSWSERASTDTSLGMPGTNIGFDVAADGSGMWWGARTPAMASSDGGRTWRALDVADGDVRIAAGGAALDGGAGFLLVGDGDRGASLLLRTRDGRSWDERTAWPDLPCCGG